MECKHCRRELKSCELATHLELYPKMEVSCELKCGIVMCRGDVTQHVEQDCVEKEIECPFAKYKCVGLMKRKNLRNHLDEKRMEHLELKVDTMQECMLEESVKQKQKISELNTTNEAMSCEITSLKNEVEILTELSKAIKLVWLFTKVPNGRLNRSQKQFLVARYYLSFDFYSSSDLQIGVSHQIKPNDDELKWPFKAKFVTHLSSQSNPDNVKKFRSEVFEWKREDFKFVSDKCTIATFTRDEFLEHFINNEVQFEIFVSIL